MKLTEGYELFTAITNVLIFICSLYCYFRLKNTNKNMWKVFFVSLAIDGFLGTIIHGITFNDKIIEILWTLLSFVFAITINTLLAIFLNKSGKKTINNIFLASIGLFIILSTERLLNIEFLYTYVAYVGFCLLIIIYKIVKNKLNKYYIYAIIVQIIGGVLFLLNVKFNNIPFDRNGIYHIFMALTTILFYVGAKKQK